ncbi:HAD family hydrolase [Pseudorhodobacter sp. E13]|uniref:sulfotransferase-like domain-containing protein n=1 Tax=Pseudorhodobacter sp. E13 TaxID=2487931 RepID=UPI000F8D84DD|nr:HAD family hydrolase [Pseudorhodobacter sp. E13]RUS59593.1 HAD family hydrolase [Pseudorhodobacter sp. E13]
MKIAMWSGPRNLSTAMMYSFAARGDCAVVDEPFYAAYLAQTGIIHPMNDEILASQPTDPAQVAATLIGSNPAQKPIFYQKHMTHHMLPGMDLSWMAQCENVFLIRHPARVIASYARKREGPSLSDIGFPQQAALFQREADRLGRPPIVIDSVDIRADPAVALAKLCAALHIPFTENMLHWPAGGHADDGIWATHWYGAVHRSTGFEEAEGPLPALRAEYADLLAQALPYYEAMVPFKITL